MKLMIEWPTGIECRGRKSSTLAGLYIFLVSRKDPLPLMETNTPPLAHLQCLSLPPHICSTLQYGCKPRCFVEIKCARRWPLAMFSSELTVHWDSAVLYFASEEKHSPDQRIQMSYPKHFYIAAPAPINSVVYLFHAVGIHPALCHWSILLPFAPWSLFILHFVPYDMASTSKAPWWLRKTCNFRDRLPKWGDTFETSLCTYDNGLDYFDLARARLQNRPCVIHFEPILLSKVFCALFRLPWCAHQFPLSSEIFSLWIIIIVSRTISVGWSSTAPPVQKSKKQ